MPQLTLVLEHMIGCSQVDGKVKENGAWRPDPFFLQMPSTVDIGTLIERSPEIHEGRPCIAGTGVSVMRIAGWSNLGLIPEEIAAKIDHLTLAQIHAALAYYHANREEIDSDIADEQSAIEEFFPAKARLV